MSPPSLLNHKAAIVFFDGECNLCNGFIDFLVRHSRPDQIQVAALQGQTAKQLLLPEHQRLLTVVFLASTGAVSERSTAVIKALISCGGLLKLTAVLLIIPRPLRDLGYQWVAKSRLKWFGKRDTCRRPTEDERAHFLP